MTVCIKVAKSLKVKIYDNESIIDSGVYEKVKEATAHVQPEQAFFLADLINDIYGLGATSASTNYRKVRTQLVQLGFIIIKKRGRIICIKGK